MKDPKEKSNKPEEANRLIEIADEDLDSVTGGCGYDDDLTVDGLDPGSKTYTFPEYNGDYVEPDDPIDIL